LSNQGLELQDRDLDILKLVYRFRFCLGRHIRVLSGFSGARACDRRLKLLVEAGYLERKKYLYGVPYLYTLSHKGRMLIGVNKRADVLRLERIMHDVYVLDAVIFFIGRANISLNAITSEKELHSSDGFGHRRHYPDFVVNGKIAVEIEIALKSKERLRKNVESNYMDYDLQYWILGDNPKLIALIKEFQNEYSNLKAMRLEEVKDYINNNTT